MNLTFLAFLALTSNGASKPSQIFTDSENKLKAAKSLSGSVADDDGTYRSTFLLQKPKSFRVIDGQIDIYCNGTRQFNHLVSEKEYFSTDVSKTGGFGTPFSLDGFFGKPTGSTAPYDLLKTTFKMQTVDGISCAAKTMHFDSFGRDDRMVYFVDAATKLPLGWDQVFGGTAMKYRFHDLRINVSVPAGVFDWKPLPGLKERVIKRPESKVPR